MDDTALQAEAVAIHRTLFGREPSGALSSRYIAAHAHVLTRITDAERDWMSRALGSDLEALEIAVRNPRNDHVLTRKMRLIAALAEASPEFYDRFVNEEPRRTAAFAALAWHALRTLGKLLKGHLLRKVRGL